MISLVVLFGAVAFSDDSEKINELWSSAQKAINSEDYKKAESNLTGILKLDPKISTAYYYRGRVRFQAGDVNGSIEDFDKHVELSPKLKSRQWERGISLYYGGLIQHACQSPQ